MRLMAAGQERRSTVSTWRGLWIFTDVPMAQGFVHLAVAVDWYSRRVLAWRLSTAIVQRPHGAVSAKPTGGAAFCIEALEEAFARHGKPEVLNADQGSQFTGQDFTGVLLRAGVAISMDGKGAWRGNVLVERLWWSVQN